MTQLMYLCNTAGESLLPLIEVAQQAISGGISVLQLRHKGTYSDDDLALAQELKRLCSLSSVTFMINDFPDIASRVDAAGVHVGQNDISVEFARCSLGSDKIVGATASTVEQAVKAAAEGADYVCMGHIYPTTCMPKPYPPIGTDILRKALKSLHIPLWAIGGINISNVRAVAATGVIGVAVVSAIQMASDPYTATRQLCEALNGR